MDREKAFYEISKLYHRDWYKSYLGRMFDRLLTGEKLQLKKTLFLKKVGFNNYEMVEK